ncbi:ankyrin repeat domain-containing protein 65-like [Sitodiplosis mosellana]|uniref:ankyrin repeat domain-containing protein 65-like n=1 Tax=Sitodiplosis mosellana TaxID=263140 RepID=UPI002443CD42|nr:ankyrin repeat domain-containing protein 65-like [Sitodiplosis mosellana]
MQIEGGPGAKAGMMGVNDKCETGRTDLHNAAEKGQLDAVKKLIKEGAKVDPIDAVKRTPLHYAAMNGHIKVVELLIMKGAEVDPIDAVKRTPLHHAAMNGNFGYLIQ